PNGNTRSGSNPDTSPRYPDTSPGRADWRRRLSAWAVHADADTGRCTQQPRRQSGSFGAGTEYSIAIFSGAPAADRSHCARAERACGNATAAAALPTAGVDPETCCAWLWPKTIWP